MTDTNQIRTLPAPSCALCGSEGRFLYCDIPDVLYGTPGKWNLKRCKGPECGLIWLDPMPIKEDIGKAYGESYYTHCAVDRQSGLPRRVFDAVINGYLRAVMGYDAGVGPSWMRFLAPLACLHVSGRHCIEATAMYLKAKPGGKLLEIGFGAGEQLARLGELGWDVQGIDYDQVSVDLARKRSLNVRQGEIREIAFPDDTFDAIVMQHVQEHAYEPVEFLEECRRILKPDGVLVSVVPNAASWEHGHFGSMWYGLDPPRHLFTFDPVSLRRAAELSGFKVEKLFTVANSAWASWIRNVMLRPDAFWAKPIPRKIGALSRHFALRVRLIADCCAGHEAVLIARK